LLCIWPFRRHNYSADYTPFRSDFLFLEFNNFHIQKISYDMKNALLLFLFFLTFQSLQAQVVYEDFEGGTADVSWIGQNGVYNGVIANPAPDAVNGSEFVGSYTNVETFDFCFALGTLSSPADLSNLNLVKMKVWSPIAGIQLLLKFEGGGNAVEMFRDITVANQWVEYSFDLGAGAPYTGLDKVLVSFNPFVLGSFETFYFDDIVGYEAKEVYEDFENGNDLPWIALDGAFEGPVANPYPNSVNNSDSCGQYAKSGATGYSLLLAERSTPFDLSILNQFHLSVRPRTAATQVLLKLEGPGGPSIEKTKNIGFVSGWQDYTFDFSDAKDYTNLTKVVLFFDPGVEMSQDTYYFDNLYAVPQAPACKGVTPDPDIIDDFECNRNATYVFGWDSLSVVNNPAPNGVNSSAKVGRLGDLLGDTAQWYPLLLNNQNILDLSTRNQLNIKIWSPRIVPILFKLEGGGSPPKEVWTDVTEAGSWIQYTIDFSSQALSSQRDIVIFFNAGQTALPGDVYFIDDIYWSEKTNVILEDFEGGAFLPWAPLDDQTLLHGSFAVINNPDPSGINASPEVGEYTKGTSAFSTLAAVAPGVIDITSRPQYNLDVWATAPGTMIFQLESESQGNKEVERDIETGAAWQTISFDFTEFQSVTDWASMRLIFNPGVAEEGAVFYFDNLIQTESTVDPCEGTVAIANIIDDFECQRNNVPGGGSEHLTAVGNPLVNVANSSTYVGLYEDQPGQPWSALCWEFPDGIDLSAFNQLSFQVIGQAAVPILMKLEGGSSPASEIWTAITTPGEWETLSVDFSNQVGQDHRRVCIFFNAGVETNTFDDYYIDNVQLAHAPFTGCIVNYEEPAFISDSWRYFPADDSGAFELIDNPDPSGINTSAKVGKATEKSTSGQPWQGMYTDLPAPIHFGADKIIKMKVWSPQVATITMKLERPLTPGAPTSGDLTVPNTKANEWEELSWDFSQTPITDDGEYARITLIFDINNIPAEDVIYYFDDIQLSAGGCGTTSIFGGPEKPRDLTVSPNPVIDELRIDDLGNVSRLDIYNMYGQRVATVWTGSASSTSVQVSNLVQGTYILNGYSAKGELKAMTRFVKL